MSNAVATRIMKQQSTKLKRLQRGQYKWRVRNNVGFVIWKDTKLVTVLSSAFHPREKTICHTQKDGTRKPFTCPVSVIQYTKRMGGVDRFDQHKAVYEIGRKSKNWWKRVFYFWWIPQSPMRTYCTRQIQGYKCQ